MLLHQKPGTRIEDRLDLLTGANTPAAAKDGLLEASQRAGAAAGPGTGLLDALLERFGNFNLSCCSSRPIRR